MALHESASTFGKFLAAPPPHLQSAEHFSRYDAFRFTVLIVCHHPFTDDSALMPTYTYRREDGSTFEVKQKITEDPLDTCPETGQDVERIITGTGGVIFKGDGFHVNDYDDHGPKEDSGADAETSGE